MAGIRRTITDAPAQRRASRFLEKLIEEYIHAGVERLPTTAVLARGAGVAYATMHKVIRAYAERGAIGARPRLGLTIVRTQARPISERPPAGRPAPGASHAERTASLLERDIVRGMFAPGEHLPSAKELCSRYGAGYRAMRRAVARVATRGFLTIEGGLRVASPLEGHYSTATVMAIGLWTPFHPIFGAPPINVLRDACLRSRVRLSVCPGGGGRRFAQTDKLLRAHVRNRRALTDTIGYLIITSGMHRAKLLEYLSLIVRLGKPIAVVDDAGHAAECASRSTAGSRIGVFPLGTGSVAGRRLGHYLANQGHRRVGYISVDHDTIPSQIRHAGLTDAIRAAGGEVVPFVRRESRPHSLLTRIFDRAWPAVRQFASSETLKHYLSPSGATMAEGYLNKALLDLLVQQVLVDTATPLIEQAARTADLTAWVAFNDGIAAVCYDVIRRRQLPIALVGFDNSLQAQQMGITSYDFSAQAVTAAALAYTLHFRGPRRPADGPAVDEIEGFVVERESTTGYRPTAKNPKSR